MSEHDEVTAEIPVPETGAKKLSINIDWPEVGKYVGYAASLASEAAAVLPDPMEKGILEVVGAVLSWGATVAKGVDDPIAHIERIKAADSALVSTETEWQAELDAKYGPEGAAAAPAITQFLTHVLAAKIVVPQELIAILAKHAIVVPPAPPVAPSAPVVAPGT